MQVALRWEPTEVDKWASKTKCSTQSLTSGCHLRRMLSCERSHIFLKHETASEMNALFVQYKSFTSEIQRLNALVKSHTYILGNCAKTTKAFTASRRGSTAANI